jgi:hypothetical protein
LILARGQTQAALEVAVHVAVIGEPGRSRGRGDRLAGFDQAAGEADTVRELQRVGGQTGARANQADEAELADARRGGEFVQADVALGLVSEIWAVSRILDSSSWFSWSGRCAGLVVGEGLGRGAVAQV